MVFISDIFLLSFVCFIGVFVIRNVLMFRFCFFFWLEFTFVLGVFEFRLSFRECVLSKNLGGSIEVVEMDCLVLFFLNFSFRRVYLEREFFTKILKAVLFFK